MDKSGVVGGNLEAPTIGAIGRFADSDIRDPKMIAEITSRPWSSVPRKYVGLPRSVQAGGVKASSRFNVFRSNGLWGATQGAKRAATA